MAFGHLKTRTRIYAGFSSLIALGVIVAAVGSWGINGLGRQNLRMNLLSTNLRVMATAVENEELIARLLLRARVEPSDENKTRFMRQSTRCARRLPRPKAGRCRPARTAIEQATLDKLDALARSADKSFELGATMLAGRARCSAAGTPSPRRPRNSSKSRNGRTATKTMPARPRSNMPS